ncbi:MAG: DUF1330 domain-containing protein [Oceanospirillaceae bacterium]|nr:DUF1330 domain-containing protein [Oceanospirillaceae bacterium]
MPKGYLIGFVKVTNALEFKACYSSKVVGVFAKYEGKFIVQTDVTSHHEGRLFDRHVIVEFPSVEKAVLAVDSAEYQQIKSHRVNNSDIDYGSFMLVSGV